MKKVLLSLTSLLFIFNVSSISADEIENMDNSEIEVNNVVENEINNDTVVNNEDVNETVIANDESKTYVASVNGVNYETLDEAINAANDNDTVILLSNATTRVLS